MARTLDRVVLLLGPSAARRRIGPEVRRIAMRTLSRFLLVVSCAFLCVAAVHAAQWAKTYGGTGGYGVASMLFPLSDPPWITSAAT